MKTSKNGVDLIKRFEGLRLTAYDDGVGVITVGYGTTVDDSFQMIKMGLRITPDQADAFLERDLAKFESAVNQFVKVPLNQNQFDALVCFVYNIGTFNFSTSTLLKKLNAGDYAGAAVQFLVWNKAGGKVFVGLTKRRIAEANVFKSVLDKQ